MVAAQARALGRAFGAMQWLRFALMTSARFASRCCFAASRRPARLLAAAAAAPAPPPPRPLAPPGSATAHVRTQARVRHVQTQAQERGVVAYLWPRAACGAGPLEHASRSCAPCCAARAPWRRPCQARCTHAFATGAGSATHKKRIETVPDSPLFSRAAAAMAPPAKSACLPACALATRCRTDASPLVASTEAADPKAKASAAAKAVAKGTMKKKVLKKRFSVTFHRCAAGGGCAARSSLPARRKPYRAEC